MAQFGPGSQLAAQCPEVPAPDGWRPWIDADGPIPDALGKRAQALVDDQALPLGTTESYPLPGVTTLLRIEPHTWGRDENGNLVQGCFRATGVYLPSRAPSAEGISQGMSTTNKVIAGLTVVSLAVGIAATVRSLKQKEAA
jgi:hypothetical protein